jgi:parallel beta-helix repeat protein
VVIGGVGTEADWWNVSYLTLYNNTDGLYIYDSNGVNVSHVESSNNTDDGIDLRQYADYAVFYNLSSHNNGGNGLYSDLLGNGQGAGRVTSSLFYSNAGYGIRSNYLLRYNFTTLQVYGNALGGINSYGSSGSMCTNLSVYSNTGAGLTLNYSYGARVVGGRVYNNSIAGLRLYESGSSSFWGNTTVSDAVIYNNTMFGIYADGTNFDYMINMTVQNATMDNHTYGMYFNKTFNCTVRNSTVLRSTFGVYLKNSTDNLFYFNNFTASASYHAYSDKAGNYFNTTNGSGCGALCARGNYWDDILSLDIYDSNADGFGDAGTEYPYNATYSAMVSVNVTDWGPITTKGPPAPPAAASMLIVGPNGTEITGTRNVLINITFGTGIACRWANDNESNLTSMPWENCTTVKPWILSESEGNKTVYMEVLAPGGATSAFNDSIMYRFMQDYTPPTAPVVYDSDYGYDVDWWNDNATIGAYWWNATDDISTIYYKYRLLNDSGCYNGDCSWTDVGTDTDVTVTGLSLQEGWNMSFEVLAYTSSGMNSSVVSSNGTKIDLTGPTVPNINSSTHPRQDVSYDNATIRFNFTATDALSGIDGYSYLLDQYPGTAPDDNKEGRYWELLESSVNDGHGQLLRANSSVGSPNTYAVFSQLKQNFTAGERIRVRAALAEIGYDTTDDMSIKVYLISGADGFAPTFAVGPAVTTVSNVTRDIRYADGMALAALYEFDLTVNGTINDNVNDTYVVITGVTGDNDNRNNLSIAYSTTSVDNSTKNYVCPDSGACTENTNTLDYAIEVKREDSGSVWDVQYDDVRDGTYYFHVKAKDVAGNWGDTAHYAVIIDTAGVAVDIISPFSGQVFSAENVTVRVKVSENANVTVIALHPDGSNFTAAPKIFTGTDEFNVTLENGTNEIYAYAINPINNVVSYAQSVFVLFGDYLPAGRRTLRVLYPGSGCSGHICESPEAGATVGVAVENGSAIFGSNAVTSDTGRFTIKIFATNPAGLESDVESDLSDDQFLDRVHPLFGYRRGVSDYVVRNELRPLNIYLGGDRQVSEGKYTMVFRNLGTTPEGKVNISVRIV